MSQTTSVGPISMLSRIAVVTRLIAVSSARATSRNFCRGGADGFLAPSAAAGRSCGFVTDGEDCAVFAAGCVDAVTFDCDALGPPHPLATVSPTIIAA